MLVNSRKIARSIRTMNNNILDNVELDNNTSKYKLIAIKN